MIFSQEETLPYRVGGLLYIPALKSGVAERIAGGAYKCMTSCVFCLEDSIMDSALGEAEACLDRTLAEIAKYSGDGRSLPLLFVRVRSPRHLEHILSLYKDYLGMLTGFVLPKFTASNAGAYVRIIGKVNKSREKKLYFMPIIESEDCIRLETRLKALHKIKRSLGGVKEYILNVRVGGSDFSKVYGLRRHSDETIYDMGVVRDALTDILNVFAGDYVVSGPVWEYFGDESDDAWANGLRREIRKDILNGFIGKTCIHPSQLPVVYDELKVLRSDYEAAADILGWHDSKSAVDRTGNRMNEVKCHSAWAHKIMLLGEVYGIR